MFPYQRLLASLLAFACSTSAVAEDFAARVDGYSIGTERVQQLIGSPTAPGANADILVSSRLAATQALVRQTVLVQAARKAQFDQDPAVRRSLELLKLQVLAEAYLGTALGPGTRPTEADIDRFIANNPTLFDKRQTIHYHRLEVPQVASLDDAALDEILRLNKNASDIAQALRRRGIDFRQQSLWQSAEQVEPELLKRLEGMANRSVELVNQPQQGRWVVLQRNASYADPVDTRAVRPAIARGLFAEQREARVAELTQRLRSEATIELFDEKSDTAATINTEPISRQTLEQRMKESGLPINAPKARQRVLDQLIDQHLLAQQAQKIGLAQQPGLRQRIAQLQEASLANQYLEHSAEVRAQAPGEREIVQFVNARPAFFAERKIFRIQETFLDRPAKDHLEATRTALAGLSDTQVQRWLDESGAVVGRNSPWLGPEKLAPAYLSALSEMKPGEYRVLPVQQNKGLAVLHLRSVHEDPLDAEQARFVAADVLRQQARTRVAGEVMDKLMAKAHIEYALDYKPRDVVRLTSAHWGKRQWAAFVAWTAHFATLVLLLAGLALFWRQSRQQVGFVVPLLNDSGEQVNRWMESLSGATRSLPFLAVLVLCLLALAGIGTLLEWNVVRTLVVPERLIAGAAGGGVLGAVLAGTALVLTRGDAPRWPIGRWTAALGPGVAMLAGVALVWLVLGR